MTESGTITDDTPLRLAVAAELAFPGGGMTSSGLGKVDKGDPYSIGGLAREYFHRLWQYYQKDEVQLR